MRLDGWREVGAPRRDGIAAGLVAVLVVLVALIALGAYGASRGWWA